MSFLYTHNARLDLLIVFSRRVWGRKPTAEEKMVHPPIKVEPGL